MVSPPTGVLPILHPVYTIHTSPHHNNGHIYLQVLDRDDLKIQHTFHAVHPALSPSLVSGSVSMQGNIARFYFVGMAIVIVAVLCIAQLSYGTFRIDTMLVSLEWLVAVQTCSDTSWCPSSRWSLAVAQPHSICSSIVWRGYGFGNVCKMCSSLPYVTNLLAFLPECSFCMKESHP